MGQLFFVRDHPFRVANQSRTNHGEKSNDTGRDNGGLPRQVAGLRYSRQWSARVPIGRTDPCSPIDECDNFVESTCQGSSTVSWLKRSSLSSPVCCSNRVIKAGFGKTRSEPSAVGWIEIPGRAAFLTDRSRETNASGARTRLDPRNLSPWQGEGLVGETPEKVPAPRGH